MADINIQEVTNHINIETANGYKLEFNGPVVNMNVVLSNYYTKTETDALLNDKADKADTYTILQINGMVQDIYTAVDTKQNLITGAASTITDSNLTTNRAVISNASGKVAVSNVTSTELGYLSGITSGVQTQLNNKASTSLDNLTAAGQMIIDSQNGTISNCILEIPQNLKLTLENNVLTLKSGSILVDSGSTYQTITITSDKTTTISTSSNNRWLIFATRSGVLAPVVASACVSGETDSKAEQPIHIWFDTTNKEVLYYGSDGTTGSHRTYPLCVINVVDGVASFAKDSNGNDMIFNGMGFVGQHRFVYPNVKCLFAAGKDSNGQLLSNIVITNGLLISGNTTPERTVFYLFSPTSANAIRPGAYYYSEAENLWRRNDNNNVMDVCVLANTSGSVDSMTIRQPYQGARNLLTDDLYKQIGDVETLLATV